MQFAWTSRIISRILSSGTSSLDRTQSTGLNIRELVGAQGLVAARSITTAHCRMFGSSKVWVVGKYRLSISFIQTTWKCQEQHFTTVDASKIIKRYQFRWFSINEWFSSAQYVYSCEWCWAFDVMKQVKSVVGIAIGKISESQESKKWIHSGHYVAYCAFRNLTHLHEGGYQILRQRIGVLAGWLAWYICCLIHSQFLEYLCFTNETARQTEDFVRFQSFDAEHVFPRMVTLR